MNAIKRLVPLAVAVLLGTLVLLMEMETARQRRFWTDEGFEVVETCRLPVTTMLIEGAHGECSPAPLLCARPACRRPFGDGFQQVGTPPA